MMNRRPDFSSLFFVRLGLAPIDGAAARLKNGPYRTNLSAEEREAVWLKLERLILEQATTQPISFYEVVRCDPGEQHGAPRHPDRRRDRGCRAHGIPGGLQPGGFSLRTAIQAARGCDLWEGGSGLVPSRQGKVEIVRLRAKLRKRLQSKIGNFTANRPHPLSERIFAPPIWTFGRRHAHTATLDQYRRGPPSSFTL